MRVTNYVLIFTRLAFYVYAVRSSEYMEYQGMVQRMYGLPNSFAVAVDVEGGGIMEVISYPNLMVYQVSLRVGKVKLTNTRYIVLKYYLRGITGVTEISELDLENDGRSEMAALVDQDRGTRPFAAQATRKVLRGCNRDCSSQRRVAKGVA